MLVDVNAMIFGMPMALFPAIATHKYGDPALVGYLYAAPYAGALASSLLRLDPARATAGAGGRGRGVAWGIAIAAFGFADTLWLGSCCSPSRARPTTSAPSSVRRSC